MPGGLIRFYPTTGSYYEISYLSNKMVIQTGYASNTFHALESQTDNTSKTLTPTFSSMISIGETQATKKTDTLLMCTLLCIDILQDTEEIILLCSAMVCARRNQVEKIYFAIKFFQFSYRDKLLKINSRCTLIPLFKDYK